MPRLFVDCNDTLVLWKYAWKEGVLVPGEPRYEMNIPLIGDVNCFLDHHPEYTLIVWSGGGVEYARGWAEKCNFQQHFVAILDKDMRYPQDQDICVDDMYGELKPRDKRVRVIAPDKFGRCPLCDV